MAEETAKKPWYKSRMIWVNVLTILATVLTSSAGLLDPKVALWLTGLAVPVVNVILRFVTTQPVSS